MKKWKFSKSEKNPEKKPSPKGIFQNFFSFDDVFKKIKNPENDLRYVRLIKELERSESLDDPRILKKLVELNLVPWDDTLYNSLTHALSQSQLENILIIPDPFQEPSRKLLVQNGYQIGITLNEKIPVFLHAEKVFSHTLILGATGTGKTECSKQIVSEINQKSPDTGIFIFDLYKNEYRSLIHQIPDLIICPVDAIKLCHLQPPSGVPVEKHISRWVDVFCETFSLPQFTRMMLRNTADRLVHQFLGRFHGKIYPTLTDIIQALDAEHGGEARFVIERLDYVRRAFGKEYARGLDISTLARYKICWEINRWEKPVQEYFVKKLTADLFSAKIENTHVNQPVIILLDEAHRILGEGSALDEIVCVARGAKIGLIVSSQQSSNISPAILANAAVKICGRMEWFELERLRKYLALTEEQVSFLRTHHIVGVFIIKYSYGDYQEPLLCKSLYTRLQPVSEKDAFRNLRLLDVMPAILRDEIPEINVSVPPEKKKPFQEDTQKTPVKEVQENVARLPKDEEKFLIDLCQHPFVETVERYKRLNFSNKKGNKVKSFLLEQDYIETVEIPLGKQGRPKLYAITDKGKTYLERLGYTVTSSGRGSLLHKFYQHLIKEKVEQAGLTARLETPTDVFVQNNGNRIGIEILTDARTEQLDRVKKKLHLASILFIICPTQKVLDQVKEMAYTQFNEKNRENIRFFVINDFLEAIQKDLPLFSVSPATE